MKPRCFDVLVCTNARFIFILKPTQHYKTNSLSTVRSVTPSRQLSTCFQNSYFSKNDIRSASQTLKFPAISLNPSQREECCHLDRDAACFEKTTPTFQRNLSPPTSAKKRQNILYQNISEHMKLNVSDDRITSLALSQNYFVFSFFTHLLLLHAPSPSVVLQSYSATERLHFFFSIALVF